MKKANKIIALLLAALMLAALAACGGNQQKNADPAPTTTPSAAEDEFGGSISDQELDNSNKAEEVNIRMSALDSLSPFGTGAYYACLKEICENLFEMDGFGGEMIPVLADAGRGAFNGYDHEAGTGDYTVYIYDYITDSKGRTITASDVKWSYDNQKDHYVVDGWGTLESVEVVDDTTVTFHFTQELSGVGELENVLCRCFIFSEESYNESPSQFSNDLTGTGPYVLSNYVPGVSISMEAREDYWQTDDSLRTQYQQANVQKINFEMIDEETQIVIGLQNGSLDIADGISTVNLGNFQDGGAYASDYSVYTYNHNSAYFLAPNCSPESLCSDVNMRLALFYSVNRDALVAALGADSTVKQNTLGSNLFGDYVDSWDTAENYNTTYDPDLAAEYLEAAGYNGEEVVLLCANTVTTTAEVLQQMWQNAGINVKIGAYDMSTSTAIEADPSAWDIEIVARGSSDYIVNLWLHYFDLSRSATEFTTSFIDDQEWADMLTLCVSANGHTEENLNAWWNHCVENAYAMGMYGEIQTFVYSNKVAQIVKTDKNQVMPGACTYTAE